MTRPLEPADALALKTILLLTLHGMDVPEHRLHDLAAALGADVTMGTMGPGNIGHVIACINAIRVDDRKPFAVSIDGGSVNFHCDPEPFGTATLCAAVLTALFDLRGEPLAMTGDAGRKLTLQDLWPTADHDEIRRLARTVAVDGMPAHPAATVH